jgi:hypothetical protein
LAATLDKLQQQLCDPFPEDIPAEDAARGAGYRRDDVSNAFFVYNRALSGS